MYLKNGTTFLLKKNLILTDYKPILAKKNLIYKKNIEKINIY